MKVEKCKLSSKLSNQNNNNKVCKFLYRQQTQTRVEMLELPIISKQADGWQILNKIDILKRNKERADPNPGEIDPWDAKTNRMPWLTLLHSKLRASNDRNP